MTPFVPVGFDYTLTVLRIRGVLSYEQIAEYCGFASKKDVYRIVNESYIPRHPQGEALWALHLELFHEKPPMASDQAHGANVPPVKRRHGFSTV